MNGKNLAFVIIGLAVVVILLALFMPRKPDVIVPESGPVVVQESVPSSPEERLAFDRRKATSACRVAVLQNAPNPGIVAFGEELDDTPAVKEPNGDFTITLTVNTRTGTDTTPEMASRKVHCRTQQGEAGWSITELRDIAG